MTPEYLVSLGILWIIADMSAQEIIEQIKELPPDERARVANFVTSTKFSSASKQVRFSVIMGGDGLPLIRGQEGTITSELVHDIESQIP